MSKSKLKILFLVIVIIIVALIGYVKISTNIIYNKVQKHLIETRGYKKEEINNISVKHSFLSKMLSYEEWTIDVTFKDEPEPQYGYSYRDGKIEQSSANSKTLDDGIYDHSESPHEQNTIIAGKYVKSYGYKIFTLLGETDRYTLTKDKLKSLPYAQIWNVQNINPNDYIGKEIVVIGFKVRNHPIQSLKSEYKDGAKVWVMISEGKTIGEFSLPIVDTVGGVYSIDGKTPDKK